MPPSVAGSIGATDAGEAASPDLALCAMPILSDDIPHIPLASVA